MESKEKYCPYCGTLIPYYDQYCPSCGKPQPVMPGMAPDPVKPRKKVWLAVLLSLLITGLGQVYIGKWKKGISFFVGTFTIGFVLYDVVDYSIIMLIGALIALLSAYDAYRTLIDERI